MALIIMFLSIGLAMLGCTAFLIFRAGRVKPVPCDCILILGTKVGSPALQERIRRGYEYLTRYPDTVAILSGGITDGASISEAQAMFQGLTAMGIDANRLRIEDQSYSTWTNLRYSLAMLDQPTAIGVVTHDYHLFRTAMHAAAQGVAVQGIPTRSKQILRRCHGFCREIAGVWHYLILGGRYP